MNAKPWHEPDTKALINTDYNKLTKIDQYQYGLWITDNEDRTGAKEPTTSLTNSPCIAKQLGRKGTGKHSRAMGRHASLFDGRPAHAQVCPEALCDEICQCVRNRPSTTAKDNEHWMN